MFHHQIGTIEKGYRRRHRNYGVFLCAAPYSGIMPLCGARGATSRKSLLYSDYMGKFLHISRKDFNRTARRRKGREFMEHRYEKEYGCLILRMPQELDHYQAEFLKEEADGLLLQYPVRNLIFDFADTQFMDSSGIGAIIGRCKNVRFSGGYVKAVNLNEQIQRVFQISGLK